MKATSTCSLFFGICLLVGRFAAAAVPMNLETWDAHPFHWKARAEGLYGKDPNGFAILADVPTAGKQTFTARLTVEDDSGDGWGVAGIALIDDERNFWHLALVRSPKDEPRPPSFELAEMYQGKWLSQQTLELDHLESEGGWKVGETLLFTLVNEGSGILGEIKTLDGQTRFNCHFRFSGPASTQGRPALHVSGGMKGTFSQVEVRNREPVPPRMTVYPPYQSDSFVETIHDQATGFFHVVQKPDGRWWAIDPLGRGVVLLGVDHVTFRGHWCETLKQFPHLLKNQKKYPSKSVWEEETINRLKTWGFNMLGAGSESDLQHRGLIHTRFLSMGESLCHRMETDEYNILVTRGCPCSSFPNVFHPDFEAYCRYIARRSCTPYRDDPWLLGYFIDNELAWWGQGALDTGLVDAILRKDATHSAKIALRDFLRETAKGEITTFNETWGTRITDWDEALSLQSLPNATETQREIKCRFLRMAADRYFSCSARAIRAADPNHMILGARFAGTGGAHPTVWEAAASFCDIVTFNCYPWADLDQGVVYMSSQPSSEGAAHHFTTFYNRIKRPILLTEWSFPALDAGLPSTNGAGQRFRTQAERTDATQLFALTLLSLPFMIGYDYFMWVDEPALGISKAFPENSNYGLVNEDCEPYTLLTQMFTELHRDVGAWRNRPLPLPRTSMLILKECPPARVMLERLQPKASEQPVVYRRDGNRFTVTTAYGLSLDGAIGERNQIASIRLRGKDYGAYNAMLQCAINGQHHWLDGMKVTDCQFRSESGLGVLELTSRTQREEVDFEITHRLTVLPDRPVILCEALTLRNRSDKPLAAEAFYFRLYAPFTGLDPNRIVPNLWKAQPAAAWFDKTDGRFVGMTAPIDSAAQVHFWLDSDGGHPHPDACIALEKDFRLAPHAVFEPSRPAYVFTLLGDGGETEWKRLFPDFSGVPAPQPLP